MYTAEQILDGFINYADNEILNKIETTKGKILLGTAISLATMNASKIIKKIPESEWASMIGLVDEDGMYDVDSVATCLKKNMEKYGKMQFNIPYVGNLTFVPDDVTLLKQYIKGELK